MNVCTGWRQVLLAVLVAVAQGGCQALSRSLFASLVPPDKTSEFFGFFAVAEKFSGVAGTGIFAILVSLTGSGRDAEICAGATSRTMRPCSIASAAAISASLTTPLA